MRGKEHVELSHRFPLFAGETPRFPLDFQPTSRLSVTSNVAQAAGEGFRDGRRRGGRGGAAAGGDAAAPGSKIEIAGCLG